MIDPESFGLLRGQVEALRTDLVNQALSLSKHMEKTDDTLAEIQKTLAEAKGGWRVMMAIGGGAATIGAAISFALSHIVFKP